MTPSPYGITEQNVYNSNVNTPTRPAGRLLGGHGSQTPHPNRTRKLTRELTFAYSSGDEESGGSGTERSKRRRRKRAKERECERRLRRTGDDNPRRGDSGGPASGGGLPNHSGPASGSNPSPAGHLTLSGPSRAPTGPSLSGDITPLKDTLSAIAKFFPTKHDKFETVPLLSRAMALDLYTMASFFLEADSRSVGDDCTNCFLVLQKRAPGCQWVKTTPTAATRTQWNTFVKELFLKQHGGQCHTTLKRYVERPKRLAASEAVSAFRASFETCIDVCAWILPVLGKPAQWANGEIRDEQMLGVFFLAALPEEWQVKVNEHYAAKPGKMTLSRIVQHALTYSAPVGDNTVAPDSRFLTSVAHIKVVCTKCGEGHYTAMCNKGREQTGAKIGGKPTCPYCGVAHLEKDCPSKPKPVCTRYSQGHYTTMCPSAQNTQPTCFFCGVMGHYSTHCPEKQNAQPGQKKYQKFPRNQGGWSGANAGNVKCRSCSGNHATYNCPILHGHGAPCFCPNSPHPDNKDCPEHIRRRGEKPAGCWTCGSGVGHVPRCPKNPDAVGRAPVAVVGVHRDRMVNIQNEPASLANGPAIGGE